MIYNLLKKLKRHQLNGWTVQQKIVRRVIAAVLSAPNFGRCRAGGGQRWTSAAAIAGVQRPSPAFRVWTRMADLVPWTCDTLREANIEKISEITTDPTVDASEIRIFSPLEVGSFAMVFFDIPGGAGCFPSTVIRFLFFFWGEGERGGVFFWTHSKIWSFNNFHFTQR